MPLESPIFKSVMSQYGQDNDPEVGKQLPNDSVNGMKRSQSTLASIVEPPRTQSEAFEGVKSITDERNALKSSMSHPDAFMRKLFQVETKSGKLPDRPGSQYKGIAQLGNDIRKPLLKKMGYTEEQYNNSKEIQKKIATEHINNLRSRLKKNGFEVNDLNLWIAHNQGVGGLNQILHKKVSPTVLKNIRNQSGMSPTSTVDDYLAYYGNIFK